METKTSKIIFNAKISRQLVRDYGCTIIDLKPDRNNKDKTLCVFKVDDKFKAAMEEITNAIKEKKDEEAE